MMYKSRKSISYIDQSINQKQYSKNLQQFCPPKHSTYFLTKYTKYKKNEYS